MRLIAISGMIGSGKTTLAKNLAGLLSWKYAPESVRGTTYLPDMFANPQRWAFDAQLAFLTDKAIALRKVLEQGLNVVLDRTLEEDIEIFAKHFYARGFIDQRSFDTYTSIYRHFEEMIPPPDVRIHCWAPLETIQTRLQLRGREIDKLYPVNHVKSLYEDYERWTKKRPTIPTISVDTKLVDFRAREQVVELVERINTLVLSQGASQYSLFDDFPSSAAPLAPRGRSGQFLPRSAISVIAGAPVGTSIAGRPPFPYVYIAAPFSAAAAAAGKESVGESSQLFATNRAHGEIGRGSYRRNLLRIAVELERHGLHSVLPHRDVNGWGKKLLQSSQVFDSCTDHVKHCDAFVGLLGQSPGSHYEFGIALALGKPSIVIQCKQMNPSYISLGISSPTTLVLRCERLSQAAKLINSEYVRDFLVKNVGGLR